jgi:acyl-[acyl-carrier-protein]-phospholipid O-acyltransferase/long-chain-fatty-acid--[acyl-carrier-protein] ligase
MTNTGKKHSFAWLNVTQFLGALNDNAFKLLIIFFLIERLSGSGGMSSETVSALATGLFAIPFLFFSALSGAWADRFSKQRILTIAKALELIIMLVGFLFFHWGFELSLFFVLFFMATQSTLFGPSKYGIVPELIPREGLAKANGYLTAFTYLAIIIGTALPPLLLTLFDSDRYAGAALISVLIALGGLLAVTNIEKTQAAGAANTCTLLFVRDIWQTLVGIRKDVYLLTAVLASAFFLHIGAFVQINIIPYGIDGLGLAEKSGYLFLAAALGIGLGALLSGKLSGRNVEIGIVPFGALGITLSTFALAACPDHVPTVSVLLVILGVSAGMFIVPINAFIQFSSPHQKLGKILAASSFLSWVGVLLAAALALVCKTVGLDAKQSFYVAGFLTLAVLIASLRILGDFTVRFIMLMMTRFCYRIKAYGVENIPLEGPALLVANHVSHVDALLIAANTQRRVRFIMYRKIYDHPLLNPIFRLMGVIPISFDDGPKKLVQSLQAARKSLDEGYLVCIFAEGSLTRNGLIREFQPGFQRIVKESEVPVVPVYIGGMWGSIFSYANRKLLSRWPMKFPYPVSVLYGEPLSANTVAHEVRLAVQELSCTYYEKKKQERLSLGYTFLKAARLNWSKMALVDTLGQSFSFGRTATAAMLLKSRISMFWGDDRHIGILMPTTAIGGIANLAVSLGGRVPVNLNYTASGEALASAIEQAGVRCIITVDVFLEKIGNPSWEGVEFLDVKELLGKSGRGDRLLALFKARLLPLRFLFPPRRFDPDDTATIIFSSGSTGMPKGVLLSHHNILSNIESFRMLIRPQKDEVMCSSLPFFHSFGFTVGLWLPMVTGFTAAYHANPLEAAKIGELAEKERGTIVLATPTFLLSYIRRVKPEQFRHMRLVVVGAEKLKTKVADAFEERFGLRPLEGYGATECSPVISINIPDEKLDGVFQAGRREGTTGVSVPGVCTKIVDPNDGQMLSIDQEGLLLVKGSNVMKGYIGQPEKTDEVLQEGWYNTGDIARIDADGFITITDRLSRFSKIGGEMVPHTAVEDIYLEHLSASERNLAVTSVPDERKGEQLAVVFTESAGNAEDLQRYIEAADIPNLWKPSKANYFMVEEIPVLGSGKLDIRGVRSLAQERVAKK